jgi:hypothetical protein
MSLINDTGIFSLVAVIKVFKTIISLVLYECETGCLILREKHRLRGYEDRLLMNTWI